MKYYIQTNINYNTAHVMKNTNFMSECFIVYEFSSELEINFSN